MEKKAYRQNSIAKHLAIQLRNSNPELKIIDKYCTITFERK